MQDKIRTMKNIHVLPTEKPSRLIQAKNDILILLIELAENNEFNLNKHIYITSDEEIKDGDWFLTDDKRIEKCASDWKAREWHKKIILTTDQDLIEDGVQAIDDKFLEWFVKNPSCEYVKTEIVEFGFDEVPICTYEIIIPKEEDFKHELHVMSKEEVIANRSNAYEFIDFDKQETLEEVIGRQFQLNSSTEIKDEKYVYLIDKHRFKIAVNNILKWQQERNKNK